MHGDMYVNLGGNHESFVPKGWKIFFMAAARRWFLGYNIVSFQEVFYEEK